MPRGRPRTKPARTTQVRKYTRRGTEKGYYSKAKKAERKAKTQAKRDAKAAAKAAELAAIFGMTSKVRNTIDKTFARRSISMRSIEPRRRKPLGEYYTGFSGIPAPPSKGRKAKIVNRVPFS